MQHSGKSATEIFGMTEAELATCGALVTAREIAQQPDLWRALADLLEARSDEIAAFLEAPLGIDNLLVVFTGAGTSAFAGGVAAAAAMGATGREMRRVATTDIVEGWSRHLDPKRPTLLVHFARSGDSPESVAALDIVDRHCETVWHLVITCNPEGALALSATGPRRFSLVMPAGSCDAGFAMTGSFSCMTLAALSIFADETPAASAAAIRRLAEPCTAILAAWPQAADLAAKRHGRVVFLGSGPLSDAASECALKLMELTDGEVVAMAYSPLAFRHGPKTIIDGPGTLIVQMISADPTVQPYGLDMLAELERDGRADRLALVPAHERPDVAEPSLTVGPDAARLNDGMLGVLYVVFGQMLALFSSLERGFRTDTPSRSGEVNRVVRNVAIYGI